MANNAVELWLEIDNTNHRALTIPLNICTRFAVFPLTWLSHLGFTICGSEGHISDTPNGQQIANYRPDAPVIQPGIYYYITGQPRWVDVDMMDDRTSDASARTARRADFRQDIINRDGTCVMSGAPSASCQACHVVPHSRGDEYIINLADYREESSLEGINDTRNGLLLYSGFHRPFGESRFAFLRTPNHAMDVTDVGYIVQPNAVNIGAAAERRLTLQHFHDIDPVITLVAPHNSDARISNSTDWPSDLVFDVSYGCAALKQWGDPTFIPLVRDRITNINRGRGRGGTGGGRGRGANGIDTRAERAARRARAKDQASIADSQDDYADVVLALWTQNTRKRQGQAEAKKADRTQDEVRKWLDSPQNQV